MTQPDRDIKALAARRDAVVAAQNANNIVMQELAGRGVGIDMATLLATRLNVFMDRFLGPFDGNAVTSERIDFEAAFQAQMAATLADIQAQVRKAILTQGLTQPGGPPLNGFQPGANGRVPRQRPGLN